MGKCVDSVSETDLAVLMDYTWPGNIRELRNVVERSMILSNGPLLRLALPADYRSTLPTPESDRIRVSQGDGSAEHLRRTLESCGWRIRGPGGAAEALGLRPTTLETRLTKLGIRRPGRPAPRGYGHSRPQR